MMKKLFVLLIKYMPTIQLVGMLVNNTLYKYDINLEFDYIGDFLLGNSIANITILYVCSYTFGFCKWHRHIIMANLVNVIIATIDKVFVIPITDMELLCSYYVIAGIFIIIAARSHVKDIQNDKRKDKKAKIVEEANKEAELFKKFQIATQANPNLTYAEFIKNVNGK